MTEKPESVTELPFMAKYIHFIRVEDKPKTSVWSVRNNSGRYQIGIVAWNPGWRQDRFTPDEGMVFSRGCLNDISEFIRSVMEMRK